MRLFLKHNLPILVNVRDLNSYSFNILSLQKEILYIDYTQLLDRRHNVVATYFRYCRIMCPRNRFGGGKRQVPVTLPTRGREMRVRDYMKLYEIFTRQMTNRLTRGNDGV